MCDFYESLGSLLEVPTEQIRDAVFGDYKSDIGPRCDYSAALAEMADDSGYFSFSGRRRNGDDCVSFSRHCRTSNKVDLSTESTIKNLSNRIGTNLSAQVYLKCRINCRHPVIARNRTGVVYEVAGLKLE